MSGSNFGIKEKKTKIRKKLSKNVGQKIPIYLKNFFEKKILI